MKLCAECQGNIPLSRSVLAKNCSVRCQLRGERRRRAIRDGRVYFGRRLGPKRHPFHPCKACGEVKPREEFSLNRRGNIRIAICRSCYPFVVVDPSAHGYRLLKKDQCEECGFRGHRCQLDVHHLDSDHSNNEPSNLQTLCANCHRMETYLHRARRPI